MGINRTYVDIVIDTCTELLYGCPTLQTARHFVNGFLKNPPSPLDNPWSAFLNSKRRDNKEHRLASIIDDMMPGICRKKDPAKSMSQSVKKEIAQAWLDLELDMYDGGDWGTHPLPWIAVATDKGYLLLNRDDYIPRLSFGEAVELWQELSGKSYWVGE